MSTVANATVTFSRNIEEYDPSARLSFWLAQRAFRDVDASISLHSPGASYCSARHNPTSCAYSRRCHSSFSGNCMS